ncbi:putative siderophore biosynthesis lipase [Cladorrhinum sp. PSN332]|nr:putative siderophore biosynthesis lipase [Cladorrhinum sp. PSN332]
MLVTMPPRFWPKGGFPGILHHYTETLVTFEFTSPAATKQPHSILFLGGLGDGLATTEYLSDLVRALQPKDWSIFSLTLTSSYQSWGHGHLDRDTDEIARCIQYIKEYKAAKYGKADKNRIVLMGHSTGSQCVLHYLSRPNPHPDPAPAFDPNLAHVVRPVLDGAIMQAPVSDREAVQWVVHEGFLGRSPAQLKETYDALVRLARECVAKDKEYDTMLPISLTCQFGYAINTSISCRRFLSLVSPESPSSPSEDDLFSSDLGKEQLTKSFGMVRQRGLLKGRLMVLMSGADQAVPDWVDKEQLLTRWKDVIGDDIWHPDSGIIPNASHALSNDDQAVPRAVLVKRVLGYLAGLQEGS